MVNKHQQLLIRKRLNIQLRRFLSLDAPGLEISKLTTLHVSDLREHMEYYFLPGMTWDNYRTEWCVDHIVPMQLFDLTKEDDLKLCWNYNNLSPMFHADNHAKDFNCLISKMILQSRPKNFFTEKLLERIEPEIRRFEKYCIRR